MDITIKNALIVGEKAFRGDIGIEGNRIEEIGGNLPKDGYVIDGEKTAVMPGMVNAHTHAAMSLFRGYADDMELHAWLKEKIWPVEAKLTEEDCYWGTMLSCAEMVRSGTTGFFDMYFHMRGVARAVGECGLRANLSHGMIDLLEEEKTEKELKEAERLVRFVRDMKSERIEASFGPHAPNTCSEELLIKTKELAEEYNCKIQIHVSETRGEVYDVKKRTGKRPVELLDSIGFLDKNVLMAHCVWLTKNEMRLIAKNGASVVSCPVSNQKLAVGSMLSYPEIKKYGVTVGIGTDGCASNNSLDMFEEMKVFSIGQKNANWDSTALPARETLELATRNGGKILGKDTGIIKKGKLADLILVDLKKTHFIPLHDIVSHLVYCARGGDVKTTICDGKILMEDYSLKIDEQKIIENAQERADALLG